MCYLLCSLFIYYAFEMCLTSVCTRIVIQIAHPITYPPVTLAAVITILGGRTYGSKIRSRLLFDGLFVL